MEQLEVLKPHLKGKLNEAAQFTSMYSGGDIPTWLNELDIFGKGLECRREPEYQQLAILAVAQLSRSPEWMIMSLKALLQAPDSFCTPAGCSRMFTGTDVRDMGSELQPQIKKEALTYVGEARLWF